jgi:hypothetical protein
VIAENLQISAQLKNALKERKKKAVHILRLPKATTFTVWNLSNIELVE